MALQQHEPTASRPARTDATSAPAAAAQQAELVDALSKQIVGALLAGDAAALSAALAAIDQLDDIHRRHQLRLLSAHQLLGQALPHDPPVIARLLAALYGALIDTLTREPREPELLGYAGVCALELGAYRSAERLLAAAQRLDPALPEIDRPLRQAQLRRRAGARALHVPADVRRSVDRLDRAAARIDERATFATELTISLCMIVRDEEEMLPRCLAGAAPGVDEIVIVDTGSRDRTVEIAEQFGAVVLHHEWTGDFGAARNIGLNAATGDWLLILDADEVIVDGDAQLLQTFKTHSWREAFYVDLLNHTGELDAATAAKQQALRLVRNRPQTRYSGLVHEQIAHALPGFLPGRLAHTGVRVDHFGYLGAVRESREKDSRNLPLLLEQLEAMPDDPFVHYNLGAEYIVLQELDKALEHLQRSWELLAAQPGAIVKQGYGPSLCARLVGTLRASGEFDELERVAAEVHRQFPDFTDIFYEQALAALDRGDLAEARERLEHCLQLGDASGAYSAMLGCGSYHAMLRLAQLDLLGGDPSAAIAQLRAVREQYPQVLDAIDPLAGALLATGEPAEAVYDELTSRELSPTAWFMLGVNLQERGHLDLARRAFEAAIERRPTLDMARVGLADLLLVQGDPAAAADVVADVPPDARNGGAAVRTELFARLVQDDSRQQRQACERLLAALPNTDLDAPTQAALSAWAALRIGGDLPLLGAEHVPALTPLMDAALRLGAGDAFADLLELLGRTGIEGRREHELAASALLRRGYPEPAADTWIAAVEAFGPDADAFAGLAESARMRGLHDDARTLAGEALRLEPDHALAEAVLAAL